MGSMASTMASTHAPRQPSARQILMPPQSAILDSSPTGTLSPALEVSAGLHQIELPLLPNRMHHSVAKIEPLNPHQAKRRVGKS